MGGPEGNALDLASGLHIPEPSELILGFVRAWYPMYDGVEVCQDNELRVMDIALSTMLNSRISGNTGGEIWTRRAPVEAALADIPAGVDLLDVAADAEIPGAAGISQAITAMCRIRRVKLAVSTKILHKKRPGLIPIFDSEVHGYYKRLVQPMRGRSWGDYAIALTHLVHEDMLSVADELRELHNQLVANGTPMTPCRILNALTWAVRSGREQEYREAAQDVG